MKQFSIVIIHSFYLLFVALCYGQNSITSEVYDLVNDSIQIPGTLSYNTNLKKQPLAIFIHGSGNIDRNGNQSGTNVKANYIKQLSEALNQNGIAFYRYDKRTSTRANIKFLTDGIVLEDFVEDAKIAISKFKEDPRFSSMILIGHSQGSLVAMLAIDDNVDKYISIAGPSSSIDTTIVGQIKQQNGDSIANIFNAHFKELKSTGTIKNVNPLALALFNPSNIAFFKSWMAYTPTEVIAKINLPTLIINGSKDLQVSTNEAEQLHQSCPNSSVVIIDQMNHVLKHITNDEDNLKAYYNEDFPLSEELISVITEFIKN